MSLLERTEGLQGGAFSRLLKTQYRMNADISDWSSQEMYAGALLAAESVRGPPIDVLFGGGRWMGWRGARQFMSDGSRALA